MRGRSLQAFLQAGALRKREREREREKKKTSSEERHIKKYVSSAAGAWRGMPCFEDARTCEKLPPISRMIGPSLESSEGTAGTCRRKPGLGSRENLTFLGADLPP